MARRSGNVRTYGAAGLIAKMAGFDDAVDRGVRRSVVAEAHDLAGDLSAAAPVKTGDLRDSMVPEVAADGLSGHVAITADHAEYVIHGTSDTEANDFPTPVVEVARRRFRRRVKDEVNAQIRRL